MRMLTFAAALLAAVAAPASAEQLSSPAPGGQAIGQSVPDPVDTPWPGGTIRLDIDASDTLRAVYRVTQTIPLAPGTERITLLFPEWLPGNHGPTGPLAELVDIRFLVGGKPAAWTRDPIEVHAFHVALPAGARELVAKFVHTSPLEKAEGRITMTQEMLNLQWEKMSLYPAGHYVRQIRIKPSVTFPAGWTAATALDGARRSGNQVSWNETDYETLVDSPIFAGQYFRQWPLGNSVNLAVVADEPGLLDLAAPNLASLSAMVGEALAIFGRPPYDRYEFLVALTSRMGGIGLEHLRSSENQLEPRNFIDWNAFDWDRNVLAHELVHSWNGKFRRPATLWTPDYRQPMQDNLLWVYEGQTQFWGMVLAARSGLQQKDTVLGMLARAAGYYTELPGRNWRPIADTTLDPVIAARKPKPFASLARGEDYYNEGALIWLEADQIIRAGTEGRRGLDDFARAFFSHPGGGERLMTYTYQDVVAALDATHRYDWDGFLRARIDTPGAAPPLAGIEMGGYRLVWRDEPNPYDKARMDHSGELNLYHSLGLTLDREGTVTDSRWEGPAFKAGIVTRGRIVAVNGTAYGHDVLKQAIAEARGTNRPIELLVRRGERYLTVPVSWSGGLRWPWLERAAGGRNPAPLDRLLSPRASTSAK